MAQVIDGFELKFVSRLRKAERRQNGRLLDTIPVTWAKSWRQVTVPRTAPQPKGKIVPEQKESFIEVWYQDAAEMEARKGDAAPLVVAVATTSEVAGKPAWGWQPPAKNEALIARIGELAEKDLREAFAMKQKSRLVSPSPLI